MFSKHSQNLTVLILLTVSMTVSLLCQNLEIVKGVRSLKQASEGVNYCDKRAKSLCRRLLPWFGDGDHLYPIQYDFRAAAKAISVNIPLGKLNPLLTKHNQQL